VRLKQQTLDEARAAPRKRPAGGGGSGGAAAGLSGDQWYSQNALRAVNQASACSTLALAAPLFVCPGDAGAWPPASATLACRVPGSPLGNNCEPQPALPLPPPPPRKHTHARLLALVRRQWGA
jgi:hypothetical protein